MALPPCRGKGRIKLGPLGVEAWRHVLLPLHTAQLRGGTHTLPSSPLPHSPTPSPEPSLFPLDLPAHPVPPRLPHPGKACCLGFPAGSVGC